MTDELDEAFISVLGKNTETTGYECRNCGQQFTSGRDARKHVLTHESARGLKALRE